MDENDIYEQISKLGFSEFLCKNWSSLSQEQLKDVFFAFYDSIYDHIGELGIRNALSSGIENLAERLDLDY